MPAPRWKNINVFPWRQESGKEGQLPFVSPFHPFPLFLAPEKYPGRVSATLPRKSNVKRSVRLIERLPASGKSAFPGFSYRTKRWPRSTALKRERRFQAAWRGNGRENACVCTTSLLTFERKGKNERGACSNPLAEDSPQTRLRSCFPPFFSKLCWICPTD